MQMVLPRPHPSNKARSPIAPLILALLTMVIAAAVVAADAGASATAGASVSAGSSVGASSQTSAGTGTSTSATSTSATANGSAGTGSGDTSISGDVDIDLPDGQPVRDILGDIRDATDIGVTIEGSTDAAIGGAMDIRHRTAAIVDQFESWCQVQASVDASIASSIAGAEADASISDIGALCAEATSLVDAAGTQLSVVVSDNCEPASESGDEDEEKDTDDGGGNAATRAAKRVWGALRGVFSG